MENLKTRFSVGDEVVYQSSKLGAVRAKILRIELNPTSEQVWYGIEIYPPVQRTSVVSHELRRKPENEE